MKPSETRTRGPVDVPGPGAKKKDPAVLEQELEKALEDSMVASDPPAVTQPEVHPDTEHGRDKPQGERD